MIVKFAYFDKSKGTFDLYREIIFDCIKTQKTIEGKKIEFVLTTKGNFLEYPDASISLNEYSENEVNMVDVYFMNDDGKTIDHYTYSC